MKATATITFYEFSESVHQFDALVYALEDSVVDPELQLMREARNVAIFEYGKRIATGRFIGNLDYTVTIIVGSLNRVFHISSVDNYLRTSL